MKPHPNAVRDFKAAFHAGDHAGMAKAMDQALENDMHALETAASRAASRKAEFAARPVPGTSVLLSMDGTRGRRVWVRSVSYGDGDGGWQVKRVAFTADRAQACVFGATSAVEVGKRLHVGYTGVEMEAK